MRNREAPTSSVGAGDEDDTLSTAGIGVAIGVGIAAAAMQLSTHSQEASQDPPLPLHVPLHCRKQWCADVIHLLLQHSAILLHPFAQSMRNTDVPLVATLVMKIVAVTCVQLSRAHSASVPTS